ncbi:SDR family NAD(P)-dependent oxidoreductase [Pelagibaculum spongiae]|uniref:Short-chain dehydrogenase n=1 Tax=Pelagibaculum spongiae TaxID=2080658 RepID=A0A2V1GUP4_9GAMM|nr:SDR family NAD(P)-dependent oxidoreductase [Pelagibaculum spongiae]PVZ66397.1 short-chain dehydrogenase [Pelagibaculum spongiae]
MKKLVWITGGGSGLGAALAKAHADNGWQVIISGRNQLKLDAVSSTHASISAMPLDISNLQQCEVLVSEIIKAQEKSGQLKRVILNAGTCEYIDQGKIEAELFSRVFATNFQGTVNCLQPLINQFEKKPLQIAVVSSISSLLPMPRAEAYGSSKAALDYLVESLRCSLFDSKIKLCLIQPGFIKTPLTEKNNFPMPGIISAEQAAKKIFSAMNQNKPVIRFPKRLHWPMRLIAMLPVIFRSKLLQSLTQKPHRKMSITANREQ